MSLTNITRTGFIAYIILTVDGSKGYVNTMNEPTFMEWLRDNKFFTVDGYKVMNLKHEVVVHF